MPQLHSSFCRGVLAETMYGLCARSIDIVCGASWYQLRKAEWMRCAIVGGLWLSGS